MGNRHQHHIGLFGGTFDPVHAGHLALARHVLRHCHLDRLLFIPAPQPPHKKQPMASYHHRLAMLTVALEESGLRDQVQLSRIEEELPRPSYTVRTVEALVACSGHHQYYLIIGADSLVDLPQWYRAADLLRLVHLIVVRRDSLSPEQLVSLLGRLSCGYQYDPASGQWRNTSGHTVAFLTDIDLPVASSEIRRQLAAGHTPKMLPASVFHYITQHNLYQQQAGQ